MVQFSANRQIVVFYGLEVVAVDVVNLTQNIVESGFHLKVVVSGCGLL